MRVPAYTVLNVPQFLTKNGMTAMPYPSNSPNLSLSNFFFKFWFPQMKKVLKGKNFANVEEEKQKWQKH